MPHCYICDKNIVCSCEEELERGVRFKYLTCMMTDEFPCIYMLSGKRGLLEAHVCSEKCRKVVTAKDERILQQTVMMKDGLMYKKYVIDITVVRIE